MIRGRATLYSNDRWVDSDAQKRMWVEAREIEVDEVEEMGKPRDGEHAGG